MTTCPQCGTENLPGMAYCEQCGAPLSTPEQEAAPAQTAAPTDQTSAPADPPAAHAATAPAVPEAAPEDEAAAAAAPTAPDAGVGAAPTPDTSGMPAMEPAVPVLAMTFPDGSQYEVTSEVTNIGRSDVAQNWHPELDVIPYGGGAPDLGVSRHQALIQQHEGSFLLIDVGSTNGTFVNGKALEYNKPVELHDGDTVAFGAFNTRVTIR